MCLSQASIDTSLVSSKTFLLYGLSIFWSFLNSLNYKSSTKHQKNPPNFQMAYHLLFIICVFKSNQLFQSPTHSLIQTLVLQTLLFFSFLCFLCLLYLLQNVSGATSVTNPFDLPLLFFLCVYMYIYIFMYRTCIIHNSTIRMRISTKIRTRRRWEKNFTLVFHILNHSRS